MKSNFWRSSVTTQKKKLAKPTETPQSNHANYRHQTPAKHKPWARFRSVLSWDEPDEAIKTNVTTPSLGEVSGIVLFEQSGYEGTLSFVAWVTWPFVGPLSQRIQWLSNHLCTQPFLTFPSRHSVRAKGMTHSLLSHTPSAFSIGNGLTPPTNADGKNVFSAFRQSARLIISQSCMQGMVKS